MPKMSARFFMLNQGLTVASLLAVLFAVNVMQSLRFCLVMSYQGYW